MVSLIESYSGVEWLHSDNLNSGTAKYKGVTYSINMNTSSGLIYISMIVHYDLQEYCYAVVDPLKGEVRYYRTEGPINGQKRTVEKAPTSKFKPLIKYYNEFLADQDVFYEPVYASRTMLISLLSDVLNNVDDDPEAFEVVDSWLTDVYETAIKTLYDLNSRYNSIVDRT